MSKQAIIFIIFFLIASVNDAMSQCNLLRSQIDVSFNTDQDCAPVTVTDFTVTYYFNAPQNPADIEIRFEWNDPGNQVSFINIGNGLIAGGGNTEFTASAPAFSYFINNDCAIRPTSFLYINGVLCPTSEELQLSPFWGTDEDGNGDVTIDPINYDVCYNNPIVNAVFTDNSEFNCRIQVEPDRPNQITRHTQFVYGTNHNPAATILNLTLEDGGTQGLTDGTGNIVTPVTRSGVTAAYFGPIVTVPTPALGPAAVTFPMNAPADAANLIGNTFEITLYNWNFCNPYNGNPLAPNYADAIATTAYLIIVDAPAPDFLTRRNDASGAITTTFCLDENIYFDNETPGLGGLGFTWEFFDDNTGATLLSTSTDINPTFSYTTPGQKLVRLTASDPTAQGSCDEVYELLLDISPSLVADIQLTDLSNNPITPEFCQDATNSLNFDVRFSDNSTGTATANTRWRWEFYDENNTLMLEVPAAGAFSSTQLGPFDRNFINPGVYRAVLTIRDNATSCESTDEEFVYVYPAPEPDFTATRVCEGELTNFTDNSTIAAINGEAIVSWEWDLDYDGVTFNKEATFDNQLNFDYLYPAAGTYNVALLVTSDQNSCAEMLVQTVNVDPLPVANFTPDVTEGCSILTVNFTNNSVGSQPDVISQYVWEIDDGSGFVTDATQDPSDPSFNAVFTRSFTNNTNSNITFDVRLRAITVNNCETVSGVQQITVFPAPLSGFNSINYSPFNDNCSPLDVDFQVDALTQSQMPSNYTWTISDNNGQVDQQSTGITPSFNYEFENNTQTIKDYFVTLESSIGGSCSGDSTITIRVNPVPVSTFEVDTLEVTCEIMRLYAEANQKGLADYAWQVSIEGTIVFASSGAQDNIEYTVNKTGMPLDVEIQLVATNFAGCSGPAEVQLITVEEEQNIAVGFDVSPLVQTLPDATIFLTNTTNVGPWEYLWSFGDGNTSTDPNLSEYTYTQAGTYSVSLTASFGECTVTEIKSITINPIPPIVDFDYNPASGCAPLQVTFTNLSQFALNDSYEWDFGDGTTSNAVNPVHTYFEPGLYSVSLTASNAFNQSSTEVKQDIIEVFETPIAQFNARPTIVFVPDNPVYTNNQSVGANNFFWDFGDGATSTEAEPIHYYQEEGFYDITLIASNSFGCADTLTREGIIEGQMNGRLLVPNAFTPNLNGPNGGDIGTSGVNDVFLPITQGVAEFEMLVFNRWGELLFKTRDKTIGWDGYYNGRLCPQDVYVYKLNLVFENGQKSTRTGDINLIR
ncbi:PKD domain-containing protein [Fulvivirga lutea]|uniref:PKD domain-containing protein n=1 Tax=Fulvivirga lutea TaxID=2810512 RepID=A0A974WFH2_9BACT|nr:PKD domain-containing protein [Fulvivirga lutea]QSE96142.1 PKD domain-containing protein [Fulvivirga lutea]